MQGRYTCVVRREDRPDPAVYVREPGEPVHLMSIKTFMDNFIVKQFHSDRTISGEELGCPEEPMRGRSLPELVRKVEYLAMVVLEMMPPER